MSEKRNLSWWHYGIIGSLTVSLLTFLNFLASIPRFIAEGQWGDLPAIALFVLFLGFISGCVAGITWKLSLIFGRIGDALAGAITMAVYFICCGFMFMTELMLSNPIAGVIVIGGAGAIIGATAGLWWGHGIRRDLKQEELLKNRITNVGENKSS